MTPLMKNGLICRMGHFIQPEYQSEYKGITEITTFNDKEDDSHKYSML